jgi:hypothetical protein
MNMAINNTHLFPADAMVSITTLGKRYGQFPAISNLSLVIVKTRP